MDKRGKSSDVLFSALSDKLSQEMKIITLEGFDVVQSTMQKIASDKPEWFPSGFNGIHAVSNPEMFAGFDVEKSIYYLSVSDEMINGYRPAYEVMEALKKIKDKIPMTFNNEYGIEILWHEIVHGITGISVSRIALGIEPVEEGMVQLAARHSYHKLTEALGGSITHQQAIIKSGLAYPAVTANLLRLFNTAGIDNKLLLDRLSGSQWKSDLIKILAEGLGISSAKVKYLLSRSQELQSSDFMAKIDVQLRNARNKGEF